MGSLIDLTGQRFGRLVVLKYAENQEGRNPKWTCKCDCGRVKDVTGRLLREGHVRSCGCLKSELIEKKTNSKVSKNVGHIDFSQIPERREVLPVKSETRIEKLPTYVGRMLRENGNTVLDRKFANLGSNGIIRSIKKQFGFDVIVYWSSNDSLIVELPKSKYETIKSNLVTGFDGITKRYP